NEARQLVEDYIAGKVEGDESALDADVKAAKENGKDVWHA
ncbi:MAG: inositol-3-phosphate synthase, partial [Bifidobacteriales bacterium]|nr:inositol-3-phosphate synthase [Bifidobacteriales bacterium]